MALVNVFLIGLGGFSDVGIRPSIIQSQRGDDVAFLRTAWTVQVVRGVVLALGACLLAWPVASFYGQPELLWLLAAASVTLLVAGFNSTSLARLSRHLSIGRLAAVDLTSQICSIVAMIAWATVQPSVWALLVGAVVGSSVRMALSHYLADRLDGFGWDRGAFWELLHFGKWIFLSTILAFLVGQSDRLIFGKLIPLGMLGVYSIAVMFSQLPAQLFNRLAMGAVFPALSRRAEAGGELESAYSRMKLPLLLAGGLVVACLIASGPHLIETLYDERYHDAGWIIRVLAMGVWFQVLQVPSGSALMALGIPRWLAWANGCKLAGMIAVVPAGFWLHGMQGAVVGLASCEILRYVVFVIGAHRQNLPTAAGDLGASALVALLAAAGGYVGFSMSDAGSASRLAASLGTVVVAWVPVAAVLLRAELGRVGATLRASSR
jgi:O-antigen/teichoic acid export membrane protein